jgi:hypothetical protein
MTSLRGSCENGVTDAGLVRVALDQIISTHAMFAACCIVSDPSDARCSSDDTGTAGSFNFDAAGNGNG